MSSNEVTPDGSVEKLLRAFLDAQLAGDRRRGLRVVLDEGLGAGFSVPELHLSVIQAAQYEIGRLWQENAVSIAQEHVATAVAQLALSQLYAHLPRASSNGRSVLVACIEGEQHEMGPRVLTDFLDMAGFDVRFVGASTPTDSLVAMVRADRPDLVALSASLAFHLPALERAVTQLRDAAPDTALGVGGLALLRDADFVARTGVQVYGRDAREMVTRARAALGLPS
jgi:methanogenic corrinoid protein MtbC1